MQFIYLYRKHVYLLLTVAMAIASLYHLTGMFQPSANTPFWRHRAFFCLDLFCVYGFIQRPKYFILLFAAFTIQQYVSHGEQIISLWIDQGRIHWISVAVLLLMPLGLSALVAEFHLHHAPTQNIKTNTDE